MKRHLIFAAILAGLLACLLPAHPARAQAHKPRLDEFPDAWRQRLFQENCANCHDNPKQAPDLASDLESLRQFTSEAIYQSLTGGTMVKQTQKLTDEEKQEIALYLTGRPPDTRGAGRAENMPNRCASNPPFEPSGAPSWNGWSPDITNARFQDTKAAGLTADQVPRLKLKWAFGFAGGVSAYGQPSLVDGRVFVGSDNGYVYSLDMTTGCVYWSFQAKGSVRTAPTVAPIKGQGSAKRAVYFGDMRANVYAINASNGELLWTTHVDDQPDAKITGAPTVYEGRVYVPVSAWDGLLVALDANSGRQIWKNYIITEPVKASGKKGIGGPVWSAPTIDVKRHVVYVGTGDTRTLPETTTSDAIVAYDLETGKLMWKFQAIPNDYWSSECAIWEWQRSHGGNVPDQRPETCPDVLFKNPSFKLGVDYDFGSSAVLWAMPDGRQVLVASSKSGTIYALDPDRKGALRWKLVLPDPTIAIGLIVFGGALDGQKAYYALVDGGLVAVRLSTGELAWRVELQPKSDVGPPNNKGLMLSKARLRFGTYAAVTAIPGVVFAGGYDGILRALSTEDGHSLWQFNTVQEFKTVNGVPGKGGSMGAPGATVAGGMLFVDSGYNQGGLGMPGNVLLAFAVE